MDSENVNDPLKRLLLEQTRDQRTVLAYQIRTGYTQGLLSQEAGAAALRLLDEIAAEELEVLLDARSRQAAHVAIGRAARL